AATQDRRAALSPDDSAVFDTLLCRARAMAPGADVPNLARELLARHPARLAACAVAGDLLRATHPDEARAVLQQAVRQLDADTPHGDRLMVANLGRLVGDYGAVIRPLDGYVALDRDSAALRQLVLAFANAGPRPRTHAFLDSLDATILAEPRYARLAG